MKISKQKYLQGFAFVVVLFGMVRCIFPQVATDRSQGTAQLSSTHLSDSAQASQQTSRPNPSIPANMPTQRATASRFFRADGSEVKNRIYSVSNFSKAFPDQNDVQLASATHWGVDPVTNREEAESRKAELVYVGANPFFYVDRLKSSIPYLVPHAAVLLQDIGSNFFDSLQIKGIPLHKIIVTSVMRSKADVEKLQGRNTNAKSNSCHLYGTTFDVAYNRYVTVQEPNGPSRRKVRNDSLKWVLSEVLNDLRQQNRCHVKYEVHQGCFHITVK